MEYKSYMCATCVNNDNPGNYACSVCRSADMYKPKASKPPIGCPTVILNTGELSKALKEIVNSKYGTKSNGVLFIKKVIFNKPATIILWSDDTKTVVKCGENDTYDPEKGLAMAIAKKALGNKGNYFETFKKWLPKEENGAEE